MTLSCKWPTAIVVSRAIQFFLCAQGLVSGKCMCYFVIMVLKVSPHLTAVPTFFSLFKVWGCKYNRLACEQAPHLGETREVTREPHEKGDAFARSGASPLARAFSHGSPSRACSKPVNRLDFGRCIGSSPRRV